MTGYQLVLYFAVGSAAEYSELLLQCSEQLVLAQALARFRATSSSARLPSRRRERRQCRQAGVAGRSTRREVLFGAGEATTVRARSTRAGVHQPPGGRERRPHATCPEAEADERHAPPPGGDGTGSPGAWALISDHRNSE